MNLQTVHAYAKATRYGSKYIYETVPRMLTIWLDLGDHPTISKNDIYRRLNGEVERSLKTVPAWKVRIFKYLSCIADHAIVVYGFSANCVSSRPWERRCL